jgi:hypothetical protein
MLQFKTKLNFILIAALTASVVTILADILQATLKPGEFGIGSFFYYLKMSGMAALSFAMIVSGLYRIRLRENLKIAVIGFFFGLMLNLVYGLGGIYENRIFRNFLDEKNKLVDKAVTVMACGKSDEVCKYSISLAKSIYYLRGEITTYSTCDDKTLRFSPADIDIDQRNHVLFVENSAERARNTSVLFFVVLIVAILSGQFFPNQESFKSSGLR